MSKRIVYDCDKCGQQADDPVKFAVQLHDGPVDVHLCAGCAGNCLGEFVNQVITDYDKAERWLKTYAPLKELT
jgi:hypothetical protein